MPSTVISSSAFASSGIALNSQSFTEDISGLVRASLTFTTTASRAEEMSQLFYVDAPPPVWPDSIDRFVLQSQQLYMVNRTVDKFAGLVTIKAQYAGALSNALSNPRVSLERKSVSFNFSVPVCTKISDAKWYEVFEGAGEWAAIPGKYSTAYDTYSGKATIGVKRISFAQVGNDFVSIPEPSKAELILGVTATSIGLIDLSDRFIQERTSEPHGEGSGADVGQYIYGPWYDRLRSVISLMLEYDQIATSSDDGIDYITPTVFVKTARYWLELI